MVSALLQHRTTCVIPLLLSRLITMTSVYDATDAVRVDLHCKVQVTQFRFFFSQMTQTGSLMRAYKQDKKCMNLDMVRSE